MKTNISGIYAITNIANKKIYIGSSKKVNYRWSKQHLPSLRKNKHYNRHLQNAWNKYGEQNFEFTIIEECSEPDLVEREGHWIEHTKSWHREIGYNLCRFVDGKIVRYNHELNDKIINLFNQGLGKNTIAKQLGTTRSTVYSCLERNGFHKNTGRGNEIKLTEEVKQQIQELRKQNKTVKEIIKITGVSKTQLNRTNTIDDGLYCSNKVNRKCYRTVTPEVIEQVKTLRSQGSKWEEIEKEVGVSRFALHENGVIKMFKDLPARKRTITIMTQDIESKIHQMLSSGHSVKNISKEIGIGQSTVRLRKKTYEKFLASKKRRK